MSGRPRKRKNVGDLLAQMAGIIRAIRASNSTDNEGPELQRFIENLKIVTKKGETRGLIMNPSQEKVWHLILESREARDFTKKPPRFIILKARQMGISTLLQAFILALIYRYANRRAFIMAHEWPACETIFSRLHFMWDNLPGEAREDRPLKSMTKHSIAFAPPHRSSAILATGKGEKGRSDTVNYFHGSEVAFWEQAEITAPAVLNTIPKEWDSFAALESTARGPHNFFADTWSEAERGENNFVPVFLPWKNFPEYFLISDNRAFTKEDRSYQAEHELSEEQLAWAVDTKKDSCQNLWDILRQEYPNTPKEAFIYSGFPWFTAEAMKTLEQGIRPPLAEGFLQWASPVDPLVEFVEQEDGPVSVWEYPDQALSYVIGMDVGEGVGGAFTVIMVLALPSGPDEKLRLVARYRTNRVMAEVAGEICYQMGAWFGWPLVAVESNNHGIATLSAMGKSDGWVPQMFGGYPVLYHHTRIDQKTKEETKHRGWLTDRTTRPMIFHGLKAVIEPDRIDLPSENVVLELSGIACDPRKKDGGWDQTRKNPQTKLRADDEVFALGIAVQASDTSDRKRALETMWGC